MIHRLVQRVRSGENPAAVVESALVERATPASGDTLRDKIRKALTSAGADAAWHDRAVDAVTHLCVDTSKTGYCDVADLRVDKDFPDAGASVFFTRTKDNRKFRVFNDTGKGMFRGVEVK